MEKGPEQDRQLFVEKLPGQEHFPEEEIATLQAKLAEADKKAADYLALLQRVQADFVNYRRRTEQTRGEEATNAKIEIISGILPVLDDFTRAIVALPVGAGGLPWVQGVIMIEHKLRSLLESEGITAIDPQGQTFDPWEHEAVLQQETEAFEEGKIIQVLSPGYKLDSRIIRPAQVAVAKAPVSTADQE